MKAYYYWVTERRIAPGAFPEEGLLKVSNFLHQSPIENVGLAWGAVLYDHELSLEEVCKYKLTYGGETYEQDE